MSSASYSIKRDVLSPTAAIIAKMIVNSPERSVGFLKLEQMLFLADWKCAQATGRPRVDVNWMHDNETVTAVNLFKILQNDNHFTLSNQNSPKSARISLAREFEIKLDIDVEQAIGAHIRFLDAQTPSALRKMCKDSYPVRSSRAGKRFQLDERMMAYKQSRRIPA